MNQPGVLDGCNLVYCAPTSGGKSLVAEIIMLRRLLTTGRPALLVRTEVVNGDLAYSCMLTEMLHIRGVC